MRWALAPVHSSPQRLKPGSLAAIYGTTKVVPLLQNSLACVAPKFFGNLSIPQTLRTSIHPAYFACSENRSTRRFVPAPLARWSSAHRFNGGEGSTIRTPESRRDGAKLRQQIRAGTGGSRGLQASEYQPRNNTALASGFSFMILCRPEPLFCTQVRNR